VHKLLEEAMRLSGNGWLLLMGEVTPKPLSHAYRIACQNGSLCRAAAQLTPRLLQQPLPEDAAPRAGVPGRGEPRRFHWGGDRAPPRLWIQANARVPGLTATCYIWLGDDEPAAIGIPHTLSDPQRPGNAFAARCDSSSGIDHIALAHAGRLTARRLAARALS